MLPDRRLVLVPLLAIGLAACTDAKDQNASQAPFVDNDPLSTRTVTGVEKEPTVPEVIIEPNQLIEIANLKNYLSTDVGVEKLFIISDTKSKYVYTFSELAENMIGIPLGWRKDDPEFRTISGFVPFDPEFGLESALRSLKGSQDFEEKKPLNVEDLKRIGDMIRQYSNAEGYLTAYPVPTHSQELMFVYGPNITFIANASGLHLSEPAILQLKIKFIGRSFRQ